MAKIDITRTELVWPGKYDEQGNLVVPEPVHLPFQVIERVNQTRATREGEKEQLKGHEGTLFDFWQGDCKKNNAMGDNWTNKLIWGDNLYVMSSLLEHYAGQIDLIYIDPPFATGADFTFSTEIGESNIEISKEQSIIEEKAYRDTWGKSVESFLSMIYSRLSLMRELLSDEGSIYVHCDYRLNSCLRLILDEVFGKDQFKNEVTWRRQVPRGRKVEAKFMPFSADYLLLYTKTDKGIWKKITKTSYISIEEADAKYMKDEKGYFRTSDPGTYTNESLIRLNNEGRIYVTNGGQVVIQDGVLSTTKGSIGVKYYREKIKDKVKEETIADNIWDDIPGMGVVSSEYIGYPTQKPVGSLERVINASSNEGNLIADFFCGSGTTLHVAEKMGRKWIGCDLSRYAIHTSRKRLMDIDGGKPFEILNLGRYERQIWQGISFGKTDKSVYFNIFGYLKFILELYGAQPLTNTTCLHGKKGGAMVHVGAVDAPVTIDEISTCLAECREMKQKELHVLGWEWEMGVANLMVAEAKGQGVKLVLLNIPREVMEKQAVEKGDIHFYELAYLEADILVEGKKARVELKHFNIPNDELIPPDVREKIKKWSDYVDYWAVDWDFQNDTFVNGWTDYRTRQKRELKLKSDAHAYEKAGKYQVMVKVIDIFGNDTSQIFPVEIK